MTFKATDTYPRVTNIDCICNDQEKFSFFNETNGQTFIYVCFVYYFNLFKRFKRPE